VTTANPEDVPTLTPASTRPPLGAGLAAGWRSVREALDKPLACYYLLLGSSALLLTIGLIMVLSASSVRSFITYDDSYAVVKRQLLWVVIGLPAAWVASRLPIRHIRRLAYPGFMLALVLLGLVAKFGVLINGNKNWLALGPVNIQPAEIAKLAIVLWAANIYAHKERRLRELHHLLVPVVPGLFAVIALVLVGRDLGTAMVLAAILLGMLWVVGAPMVGTPDLIGPELGLVGQYHGSAHLSLAGAAADIKKDAAYRDLGLETVAMVASDWADPDDFVARLLAAARRARGRTASPAWTLDPPAWWTSTHTVAQRRALGEVERRRYLGYRRAA
jgi:hypothetical protein